MHNVKYNKFLLLMFIFIKLYVQLYKYMYTMHSMYILRIFLLIFSIGDIFFQRNPRRYHRSLQTHAAEASFVYT